MRASLHLIVINFKQSGLHQSLMKAALFFVLTFAFCLFTLAFSHEPSVMVNLMLSSFSESFWPSSL
jgi:hypothetical protein